MEHLVLLLLSSLKFNFMFFVVAKNSVAWLSLGQALDKAGST